MYADLKRCVAQPAFSYPCIYTVIEISCMCCDFKKAVAQPGINTIIEISRYALWLREGRCTTCLFISWHLESHRDILYVLWLREECCTIYDALTQCECHHRCCYCCFPLARHLCSRLITGCYLTGIFLQAVVKSSFHIPRTEELCNEKVLIQINCQLSLEFRYLFLLSMHWCYPYGDATRYTPFFKKTVSVTTSSLPQRSVFQKAYL